MAHPATCVADLLDPTASLSRSAALSVLVSAGELVGDATPESVRLLRAARAQLLRWHTYSTPVRFVLADLSALLLHAEGKLDLSTTDTIHTALFWALSNAE